MSDVKRYNALVRDGHALDSWHSVVLASDYDALAQRCAELEADNQRLLRACAKWKGKFQQQAERSDEAWCEVLPETIAKIDAQTERDTLRAEVERLRHAMERVNYITKTYADDCRGMPEYPTLAVAEIARASLEPQHD